MKFIDVHMEEAPIAALMEKLLQTTGLSSVRVFSIDYLKHKPVEKYSTSINGPETQKPDAGPVRIFELLKKKNKALFFDDDSCVIEGEKYEKFDKKSKCEIYIPLYKELDKAYCFGLILLASDVALRPNILDDEGVSKLIREMRVKLSKKDDIARRKESMYQITYMLCEIIDGKEPYLISRLFNVVYWGVKIAKHMGVSQEDVEKLQIAILMHDLGKIYIDEGILNKKGKLTENEYETVKQRVVYSYEIAQKLNQLYVISDLPDIILNCQERVDGKGYPNGKKGDEIPFLSKILGTAKAISSMLVNTSYRRAKTIPEVISELKYNANRQFDEKVVQAAISLLANEEKGYQEYFSSIGTYATLNIRLNNNKDETKEDSATKANTYMMNIWGNMRKIGDEYVFTPTKKTPNLDTDRIKSCRLYVSINEKVYRYVPEIKNISADTIVFSRIDMVEDTNAFAIRWLLDGYFVSASGTAYNSFVTMVGGDFVDFYIFSGDIMETFTQGVIRIKFEDGRKSTLPGMIIFSEMIGDKTHFRLKFTGIQESEKRVVFAEIFKKQVTIKSLLREGRY